MIDPTIPVPQIPLTGYPHAQNAADSPLVDKNANDILHIYAKMYPHTDQTIGSAFSPYAIVALDRVTLPSVSSLNVTTKDLICDTANNRITILTPGDYNIVAVGTYNNTLSPNSLEIPIFVNGTQQTAQTTNTTGSVQCTVITQQLLSLNANDYVEMRARSQGGNQTLFGNIQQTYLLIFKV